MRNERGAALVVAMMAMLVMTTLAAALVLTTSSETLIASSFRGSLQALYAADAALEWALLDVAAAEDWNAVAAGASVSQFVDGPAGSRTLADGTAVDLVALTLQNDAWQLYAHGPLNNLLAQPLEPAFYIAVFVAAHDDLQLVPSLRLRAEVFGARDAHKVVEAIVSRDEELRPRLVSWQEVR